MYVYIEETPAYPLPPPTPPMPWFASITRAPAWPFGPFPLCIMLMQSGNRPLRGKPVCGRRSGTAEQSARNDKQSPNCLSNDLFLLQSPTNAVLSSRMYLEDYRYNLFLSFFYILNFSEIHAIGQICFAIE